MNLREIDLNLLLVFNQLLLDRSVSTAAEKLGLTQPAVSNALKRLRAVLKDELFLRTSRGMEPTPYALYLAEPVIYALNALQAALTTRDSFDPKTSSRNFQLAMTDIGEMYFMPPLMVALSRMAPNIRISTVRPNSANLKEDMESGTVDLALGLLPNLQTGFFQRRLFHHKYVCVFRKGHPVAKSPMTLAQFTELDHVGVVSANTGHGEVDGLLERAGIKRKMRLVVPHFIAVGHILQTTDLIATLPERFAQRCEAPFGLVSSPHPARIPDIAINLFWHAKFNRDPASLWMRQLLVELFADSEGK
ncbi:LysR family transcriptional regulator [Polaromonas hydrogenivorans]|uniref:LysR family transcriptional regulator n=1 Tax=Polaromonas hydrogenivorans TaxID=335476 RepID=A0AAU7M1E1_9BURK